MPLPQSYLDMNDLVCKVIELPDGAKMLDEAVAEAKRQSEREAPLIRESIQISMNAMADRVLADLEQLADNAKLLSDETPCMVMSGYDRAFYASRFDHPFPGAVTQAEVNAAMREAK